MSPTPLARLGLTLVMTGTALLLRAEARATSEPELVEPEPTIVVFGPITFPSSGGVAPHDATPTPRPRDTCRTDDATAEGDRPATWSAAHDLPGATSPATTEDPETGSSPAQPGK